MREIHGHETNNANRLIAITADDADPNYGNASHDYEVRRTEGQLVLGHLQFQQGPIAEVSVNGLTHEVLLAIVIDRLRGFQTGVFANPWNETALTHCQAALAAMQERTREREARGVEGTYTV